jgi:oxygen-independent coproporphyrinogen-3 oxidase
MIYVQLNEANFEYDIYSLVKAFYPREEIRVEASEMIPEGEISFLLVICYRGDRIDLAAYDGIRFHPSYGQPDHWPENVAALDDTRPEPLWQQQITVDAADRKDTKSRLKLALYDFLTKQSGRTLPWGTLTGIRPTKIPLGMLEAGKDRDGIYSYMEQTYRISPEKARLSMEVAGREYDLLRQWDYTNGYSLYVGIPFCPSTCLYCSFPSYPMGLYRDRMDDYLDAVEKELDFTAELMKKSCLTTIYIGGGTPTSLDAGQLHRLFSMLEQKLDCSGLREITVEAGRPDSITPEKLQVISDHGIGRISINPQTMNQKTLDLIGRHHSVEDIKGSFALAREMGFDDINMDLILGLPGETIEDVAHTMEEIKKLAPDNLTVHSLAIKRSARLNIQWEKYRDMEMTNSDEHMALAMHCAAELGMQPYYLYRQKNMAGNLENIGFAPEGREGLYNILIMEEKQTIVACGAGATTKRVFADKNPDGTHRIERCENVKDVAQYMDRIDEMIERKRELFGK